MRNYLTKTTTKATWMGGDWLPPRLARMAEAVEPGTYRMTATTEGANGRTYFQLGRKVDPRAEAARLRKLNETNARTARTWSPGIQGYQQRADASHHAQQASRFLNEQMADWLDRERLAGR